MSLPKLSYPTFEVTVPSSGDKIKFRPFLVKEEKILLIAQTGGDAKEILNAIKQVVNNCIVTEKFDVEKLTTFDLEYIFIKLRSKSVNNVIKLSYRDGEDDEVYDFEVDLDKVEMKMDPEHSNKIKINDEGLGMILKYPRTDMIEKIGKVDTEIDVFFEVLKYCIEKVYDAENVYDTKEYEAKDIEEFIQSLDVNTFKQIQRFFETTPKLYYEMEYKNKLGKDKKIVLQNLTDFFTLG